MIIVCLVLPQSQNRLQESTRVVIVEMPTTVNHTYRQVVHLAANMDNVKFTEDLLSLQLAPFLFCWTSSTQNGKPPFLDGYTQSKYSGVCE